ncbi:unnamed protein product [Rotaria socialis]|uniref:Phospholipid/glycerol acyltransferase domain-containing protein n=1 Tax=Rotaria socialis TaxID=392032 RepID=A0A817Q217_9BILA|nr:unnamed protein product [Rotaria socialis]CAF3188012.1 unnamed protein product [Rotaria socialis]CAF3520055.1 unnamed protein product [Rotaria socialis]CAF4210351.1 unnamed protein product [Rotaria socialis]CAF4334261.1 unnamed protein product [Rotaria socialis]
MSTFNPIEYDDLIYRHRQSSDLLWSLKNWHDPLVDNKEQSIKSKKLINKTTQVSSIITPVHYETLPRNSEQIKSDVLNSLALKYTLETLGNDTNANEQAKSIIQEMSHRLNIRTARFLAFIFSKIFNQVYENIYIDRNGIDCLYKLYCLTPNNKLPNIPASPITISSTLFAILNTFSRSSSSPDSNLLATPLSSPLTTKHYITSPRIIYLPTHRSYMDFIILTYLCFEYNIPLPCIAAAQDFLGLGLLANLLRHCGAFFIRRSFRSDLLYWTIFDEYVKTHLIHGDYPLEFFIEGARSRTLKTLLPVRQGMLKSCLECYFRRQVDNLILIPISINYEKVLEDNLHANELLGIPKPKESKSGLFKSIQILKKSFGTMIVKFSDPIYVYDAYELFKKQQENKLNSRCDSFNRSIPRGVQPRFTCQPDGFNELELNFVDQLSYRIVHEQQRLTAIYPITVVAFSFLSSFTVMPRSRSVSLEQLFADKETLFIEHNDIVEYYSTNCQIFWPSNNDKNNLKQRLLSLYSDVFDISGNNHLKLKITGDNLVDASLLMKLIMYRNTCLHLFAKPAYILLACQVNSQASISYQQLKTYYHFFIHLFAYEFVYDQCPVDNIDDQYFDRYLTYWINKNYIFHIDESTFKINSNFLQQISLITSPFEQYARAYLLIYEQGNNLTETSLSVSTKVYQKNLLTKLDSQNIINILASSSNVISNALRTLNSSNASKTLSEIRHILTKIFQPVSIHLRAKL